MGLWDPSYLLQVRLRGTAAKRGCYGTLGVHGSLPLEYTGIFAKRQPAAHSISHNAHTLLISKGYIPSCLDGDVSSNGFLWIAVFDQYLCANSQSQMESMI